MQEQTIKVKINERYRNSESCCAPAECCSSSEVISAVQMAKNIGYDGKELEAVPESSILGMRCGAPVNFADIKEGEVVVDIGSGGGIDVFYQQIKSKIHEKYSELT
ncbi:MAG: hypothetical protein WBF33_19465 [Candidatus Nitrosopolaris sp.]|jgi:arsenite methyltransferase